MFLINYINQNQNEISITLEILKPKFKIIYFKKLDFYLNHPLLFVLTSGDVLILGESSDLPLIIMRGTIAQRAKNNIQNR